MNELSRAFALAVPSEAALAIRDNVGFFQAIRAAMLKGDQTGEGKTDEDLSHAVRQIVSGAVASEGVIDIFSAAGLKKPDRPAFERYGVIDFSGKDDPCGPVRSRATTRVAPTARPAFIRSSSSAAK